MAFWLLIIALICLGVGMAFLLTWDKGRRSFVLAARSLWLHKLRSFLSVLGIIIGTGAVILLMAFGEGTMQDALEDIRRQGATNIHVKSEKPPEGGATSGARVAVYGLTYADYLKLQEIDNVVRHVPMRIFPQELRYLERVEKSARVVETTHAYEAVFKVEVAEGRFLDEEDDHLEVNNVVLGSATAKKLFPQGNALGESISIGMKLTRYRVIGVLKERLPNSSSGGNTAETNSEVYIPLRTGRGRFGETLVIRKPGSFIREQIALHQITLTISDMDKVRDASEVIKKTLNGVVAHKEKKDFKLEVPLDRLEAAEREKNRLTILLVSIASISLLVGGIGIMNIMLATVTERTREIGIRRALGAKRRDITLQFLVEAVVQTSVGGLVGVMLGLGVVFGIPLLAKIFSFTSPPLQIHDISIPLSLVVTICVGVLFGWYPARNAALLDPIEALRHE